MSLESGQDKAEVGAFAEAFGGGDRATRRKKRQDLCWHHGLSSLSPLFFSHLLRPRVALALQHDLVAGLN